MASCITFSDVSKRYGSVMALRGVSFEVQPGEVLGLLGPNGAGKSTTLHLLTGLVRPQSGSISVFGKDLRKHFVDIAARMGVLFERPVFCDALSVRRNLKLQARLARVDVNVDRALALAGMLDQRQVKAGTLSQGMRQRVGLAQAMLTEPELLILDEPTSGLDVEASQEILALVRRLNREAGVTVLFSSHLMHEVEALCDRVAILNRGVLVRCERTDKLLSYDQRQVEVLLDGGDGAAKRLNEQRWVESVEVRPGRLLVRLREGSSQQLNSFLVNAGYPVSGVIPRRRTMQDYFLKVINEPDPAQERDEA